MRILHVLHQYLPEEIGGTELYTRTLSQKQAARGHAVAIFVPAKLSADWPEPGLEDGVRVYRFPNAAREGLERFRSTFVNKPLKRGFEEVLGLEGPDIVHIQHLMGLPLTLVKNLVNVGIPYVLTLHDYWSICANAQLLTNYDNSLCSGPKWWVNCSRCALARLDLRSMQLFSPLIAPVFAWRDYLTRKLLEQATWLVAPTPFVGDIYRQHGINASKIKIIPHGIETPSTNVVRRDPVISQLQVAYIGGLSWQKGVHILIDAFNRLPHSGARLHIWGDPKPFPSYVNELGEMANHPGIEFMGPLDRKSLWNALSGHDVVVVPSLWYETSSLIIQEAFAAGVPVVASKMGALKMRVNDGVDGILVPPGDPEALSEVLINMMNKPELLLHLRSGIQPVDTISDHMTQMEELYESALQE